MGHTISGIPLSRRRALALLGGALAAPAVLRFARAQEPLWWQEIEAARLLVGAAVPVGDAILIDMPVLSEDGTSVPFEVTVNRPMDPAAFVASIHLFANRNPFPEVADFFLSPLSGRAQIATRIRVNESQTIGVIAVMNTGEVLVGSRDIEIVTIGCLLNPATYVTDDPMFTRVRVAEPVIAGAATEVTTLIKHPMETGLRLANDGTVIPRNLIERFLASYNRATVFEAHLHRAIAVNPYIRFFFAPAADGELVLRWEEDTGLDAVERVNVRVA